MTVLDQKPTALSDIALTVVSKRVRRGHAVATSTMVA